MRRKKFTHYVASFIFIIYFFSFILYTSSIAMLYLIIVFLIKSNHWTKTIESELQCLSWSRCLENFVRYRECRLKNRLIQCFSNLKIEILRFRSKRLIFFSIIYFLRENFSAINSFTNLRMIVFSCSKNNWRFFANSFIMRSSFNRLSIVILLTSCLRAIARHESLSFWIVVTIKDSRFDLSIFLIFLSEEDFNTEARQLNNDEDEEKKTLNSISKFATRNRYFCNVWRMSCLIEITMLSKYSFNWSKYLSV